MQSPEQFMREYFAANLRHAESCLASYLLTVEPFFAPTYVPSDLASNVEAAKNVHIERIIITNDSVEVITTGYDNFRQFRYILRSNSQHYRIALMERCCPLCFQKSDLTPTCPVCKGKGWMPMPK